MNRAELCGRTIEPKSSRLKNLAYRRLRNEGPIVQSYVKMADPASLFACDLAIAAGRPRRVPDDKWSEHEMPALRKAGTLRV